MIEFALEGGDRIWSYFSSARNIENACHLVIFKHISTAESLLWEWGIVENHSSYELLEVKDEWWLHSEEGWGSCPGKPSPQSACIWAQRCLLKGLLSAGQPYISVFLKDPFSVLPYPSLNMVTFLKACRLFQKARAEQPEALEIRWAQLEQMVTSTLLTHMWERQCPCCISSWVLMARVRTNSHSITGFFRPAPYS